MAKKKTLTRAPKQDAMEFTLHVRVQTKKDSHAVLMDLIEKADKALTRPSNVKMVEIRGVQVEPEEES